MNVSKIKSLSEQHVELKLFHENCSRQGDMALSIAGSVICTRELTPTATRGIIMGVRKTVLSRIAVIESEIKAEIGESKFTQYKV